MDWKIKMSGFSLLPISIVLALGLPLSSGCGLARHATLFAPGKPVTDKDFDIEKMYPKEYGEYGAAVDGALLATASVVAAPGGKPCPAAGKGAGASSKLVFCTQDGKLVVEIQDADGKPVTSTGNAIGVLSSPPGLASSNDPKAPAGATTATAVNGLATLDGLYLRSPGTYTLTAYASGLTEAKSDSFTVPDTLDRAKLLRNKIVELFMGNMDKVYGDYMLALDSGKAGESMTADFVSLGLTASSAIALVTRTKTILAALATAWTGLGASVDKNVFGQQTFAALAIAMQARRNTARASIVKNEKLSVMDYPLEAARRELISFFYAGTLPAAIQEIQEEAATKSKEATSEPTPTPTPTPAPSPSPSPAAAPRVQKGLY